MNPYDQVAWTNWRLSNKKLVPGSGSMPKMNVPRCGASEARFQAKLVLGVFFGALCLTPRVFVFASHLFHMQKGLRPNSRILVQILILTSDRMNSMTRSRGPTGIRAQKSEVKPFRPRANLKNLPTSVSNGTERNFSKQQKYRKQFSVSFCQSLANIQTSALLAILVWSVC